MKEEWHDQLQAAMSKVPQHDVLLIMGDMNAKTGSDNTVLCYKCIQFLVYSGIFS